jgi:hypothetical protein
MFKKDIKNFTFKFLHLKNMKNIIILIITTLISQASWAVSDNVFLVTLNKCVNNQMDLKKSEDFKILAADDMSIVCARDGKLVCKIMEKVNGSMRLTSERSYEVYSDIGDYTEIRNSDDHHQSLIINTREKTAMYLAKEISSKGVINHKVCSGKFKDAGDIKKISQPNTPKKTTNSKTPINIIESDPGKIGE